MLFTPQIRDGDVNDWQRVQPVLMDYAAGKLMFVWLINCL